MASSSNGKLQQYNLARAELYMVLGKVLREFEIDIAEVVRERDTDVVRDVIIGVPSKNSRGVVVGIKDVEI